MTKMTGGRFIAETFKGYGVGTVFFVPAVAKRALMEMEKLGIRRILCHTEKGAAYMADGYARAARRPGVAMAQSVGAANLAAGLQDAWLARSPVIALTARWPHIRRYRHAYQEIDHWPLYEPVTKFNAYVDTVHDLPLLVRQAFREATTGAPGPVHLALTGLTGEMVLDAEAELEVIVEQRFAQIPALRPEADLAGVARAADMLRQAQRPVIIAGGGVSASGAQAQVVQLAEMLSIPVATSLNAKGTIREDHPLALGIPGTYSRWCSNQIVSEADLVLFVGSHAGGQVTHFWRLPKPGTAVIQIDIDPTELGRNYPAAVELLGDAKVTLQKLNEHIKSKNTQPAEAQRQAWANHARRLVAQWRQELAPRFNSDDVPIRPERICAELARQLPSNAILVSDTGHAGIWSGTMIDLTHPSQSYLRCAGSLGWALPAAMGAKCSAPERPVICFTGDGGFWYHMSELETAVRCGIRTVTVVNNNHSLNQVRSDVDRAYAGQAGASDEIWVFQELDLARVAESMGCLGIRVERPADIQNALERALAADRPAVVDIASDIDIVAPTPVIPG